MTTIPVTDKIGPRGRKPITVIITGDGLPHMFCGQTIPGVCHATVAGKKKGRWGYTTYRVSLVPGSNCLQWQQLRDAREPLVGDRRRRAAIKAALTRLDSTKPLYSLPHFEFDLGGAIDTAFRADGQDMLCTVTLNYFHLWGANVSELETILCHGTDTWAFPSWATHLGWLNAQLAAVGGTPVRQYAFKHLTRKHFPYTAAVWDAYDNFGKHFLA